jgi:hypothetical protein
MSSCTIAAASQLAQHCQSARVMKKSKRILIATFAVFSSDTGDGLRSVRLDVLPLSEHRL